MQIEALWYAQSWRAHALRPLASLLSLASAARRGLYRSHIFHRTRLGVPVVVVGNITVGGTGKTPLTQWLAERLQARGRSPGVVVRSYGASAAEPARVVAESDPAVHGDEAVMLASVLTCPVWSGPMRARTASAMIAAHADLDTVLCDDGLQHYALARDVEIAVVDAVRGFGNGWLLPAGPLREPLRRLASVHAIVLNGPGTPSGLPATVPQFRLHIEGERFRNLCHPQQQVAAAHFGGKRVVALAGTGHPARFFGHLEHLGLAFDARAFPDHHRYAASEVRFPAAEAILMTEKDAIKCRRFADARMWALPVTATTSEDLVELVLRRVEAVEHRPDDACTPNDEP
jgi:tetraacyldisaccharide 4'-kinase